MLTFMVINWFWLVIYCWHRWPVLSQWHTNTHTKPARVSLDKVLQFMHLESDERWQYTSQRSRGRVHHCTDGVPSRIRTLDNLVHNRPYSQQTVARSSACFETQFNKKENDLCTGHYVVSGRVYHSNKPLSIFAGISYRTNGVNLPLLGALTWGEIATSNRFLWASQVEVFISSRI